MYTKFFECIAIKYYKIHFILQIEKKGKYNDTSCGFINLFLTSNIIIIYYQTSC